MECLRVRWSGAVRGARGGEAVHGGVVAGHGAGHGRLQDQAEGHPGALQGRHQAHVRLLRRAALALRSCTTGFGNVSDC